MKNSNGGNNRALIKLLKMQKQKLEEDTMKKKKDVEIRGVTEETKAADR